MRLSTLVILALSVVSFRASADVVPMEDVTFTCEAGMSSIYVDTKNRRVWVGSETNADEVTNTKWMIAKCPHCYSITGELLGGKVSMYTAHYNFATKILKYGFTLKYGRKVADSHESTCTTQ